jgi:phenylacetate-CoA ligase
LKLKIEYGNHVKREDLPGLKNRIATSLHNKIKIRPEIEFVQEGALVKELRKTPIFEKRYEQKSR